MAVSGLEVHGVIFPAVVLPPCSTHGHFLAGAGVLRTTTPQPWTPHHDDGTENCSEQPRAGRRVEIWEGFLKFAVVGIYLQVDAAVLALETKWAGWYAVHRLASDAAFFRDVVTGEFEKFTRVTMILPISGDEYARTVTENCVAYLKATGAYTAAEAAAVDKFEDVFRLHFFSPGESVLFTHSMAGVLTVAFSRDSSVPESGGVAIENRPLCEAVLESIIGEHGDSPAAKLSLATRVADLLRPMRQGEGYGPGDTHRIR